MAPPSTIATSLDSYSVEPNRSSSRSHLSVGTNPRATRAAELETALLEAALDDDEQYATVTDELDRIEHRLDELSRQFTAGDYRAEIVPLDFYTD